MLSQRRQGAKEIAMYLCALAPWREAFVAVVSIGVALVGANALAGDVSVDAILNDLHRPCGVAVRPGGTADRYEVFLADSGAGRVLRWSNLAPKQAAEVVTGFKTHPATDLFHQTGPLALWFFDPGLLVVSTTRDEGGDLVRAFELPDGAKILTAETTVESNSERDALEGATCYALTRSRANEFVPDMLFLAIRHADGHARLMKARVQAGIVGEPQPFGPQDASEPPRAVAISNSGRLVVGDAGGRLSFYSPIDGKVELTMPTDVKQLVGLAYGPTSGSLYAADFAGGIHRIDDASEPGRPACRTVKVADVSRPTALAFAPDGALYVVTFGNGDGDGTLEVITGDL
jgi:hypothetical protein